MKILHIHPTMRSGGIEAIICSMVNEMSIDNDVTLCTIFEPNSNDVFLNKIDRRVRVRTIGKKNKGFSIKEIFKIFLFVKNGHFDVVHMHGCFYYYLFTVALLFKRNNFVYTVHSNAFMENVSWDKFLIKVKRFFFRHKYIKPVTISPVSQESFRELYGCDSFMIFNGIQSPRLKMSENLLPHKVTANTLLFIHPGRITQAKNQIVLCKAFKRVIDEGHDVVLLIYGSPEDSAILNEMSSYFSDRIKYMGETDDVPSLMAQADAFCLPSIWEGLPVTLLEALAVGCIPICSPVGGIVNVVQHNVNGILSTSESETDYYHALKSFLEIPEEEKERIRKQALKSFADYSITKTSQEYLKVYKNI